MTYANGTARADDRGELRHAVPIVGRDTGDSHLHCDPLPAPPR